MINFGYTESELTDTDANIKILAINFPDEYRIIINADVFDQGNTPSCVSCALTELMHYHATICSTKYQKDFDYLYINRPDKSKQTMTPKEGFKMLFDLNYVKNYGKIGSIDILKKSLFVNGPAIIGLFVRSKNNNFWIGNDTPSGHAVAVVGYNNSGFLIKNSWGYNYGLGGYWTLPYEKFTLITECWTILN